MLERWHALSTRPRHHEFALTRLTRDDAKRWLEGAMRSAEPGRELLAYLYRRFFERIQVDEAWVAAVREASARGSVVYVLRNLSFLKMKQFPSLRARVILGRMGQGPRTMFRGKSCNQSRNLCLRLA